jgi:anti-sigma regulatory factor (Ser/Thr protein kinase)
LKKDKLILKLDLLSDPQTLCVVRAAVGELAATLGLPPEEGRSLVLAVDEAMTNIIRHAYLGKFDRPIEVSFYRGHRKQSERMQDTLEIRFVDEGVAVDPAKLRGRELEEVRPGGLGLHFIRQTMDDVTFRHFRGRNHLRLVKFLTSGQPPDRTTGDFECS